MTDTVRRSVRSAFILNARVLPVGKGRRPWLFICLEDFTRVRCSLTKRGLPYTGSKFDGQVLAQEDRRYLAALYNEGLRVARACRHQRGDDQ